MLEEGCPTSRDLAQSVVIALIQHICNIIQNHALYHGRSFADPWITVRAKFKQAWELEPGMWVLGLGLRPTVLKAKNLGLGV